MKKSNLKIIICVGCLNLLFSIFLYGYNTNKFVLKLNDTEYSNEFKIVDDYEYNNFNSNSFINSDNIVQKRSITKTVNIRSNTACSSVSDKSCCISKLSADVYVTNANSDKWVVLIHGVTSSGASIYNSFGSIYEYIGYNIITPDLRGHGKSGGTVSFGYLDSLDIYDWIKDLNLNWKNYGVSVQPKTIIVHGHSMGAATMLQLATNPDIASANGGVYNKNLTQLNVKGFIDGAGYTSMSRIAASTNGITLTSSEGLNGVLDASIGDFLMEKYKLGLTSSNYKKYSNVFSEERKFPSGSKIMIIHGTDDSIVPFENASIVAKNVSPGVLVRNWAVDGLGHNAISENIFYQYGILIYSFSNCLNDPNCTSIG